MWRGAEALQRGAEASWGGVETGRHVVGGVSGHGGLRKIRQAGARRCVVGSVSGRSGLREM